MTFVQLTSQAILELAESLMFSVARRKKRTFVLELKDIAEKVQLQNSLAKLLGKVQI